MITKKHSKTIAEDEDKESLQSTMKGTLNCRDQANCIGVISWEVAKIMGHQGMQNTKNRIGLTKMKGNVMASIGYILFIVIASILIVTLFCCLVINIMEYKYPTPFVLQSLKPLY